MDNNAKITAAIEAAWRELERQHQEDGADTIGYVDRDLEIVDGRLDMRALVVAILESAAAA